MDASLALERRRSVGSFGAARLSGGCMLHANRAAPQEIAVTAKTTNRRMRVFMSGELISLSEGTRRGTLARSFDAVRSGWLSTLACSAMAREHPQLGAAVQAWSDLSPGFSMAARTR